MKENANIEQTKETNQELRPAIVGGLNQRLMKKNAEIDHMSEAK